MCSVILSKNLLKQTAKLHQKKYRDETGLFIAEGVKVLEELIEKNIEISAVFTLKELNNDNINAPVYVVNEAEMKKISGTDSVCSVLSIARKMEEDIETFKKLNKIGLLEAVSDPGNLGTIIRSAAAFGIEGLILYGNCTDLYSSKVIRSSAGNFFKIPVIHIKSIDEFKKHFKNHIKIAAALSKENNISFNECRKLDKYVIMFGSEASGLSEELLNTADRNIKIEMHNNVDSLNLGISAAVIFYELQKSG